MLHVNWSIFHSTICYKIFVNKICFLWWKRCCIVCFAYRYVRRRMRKIKPQYSRLFTSRPKICRATKLNTVDYLPTLQEEYWKKFPYQNAQASPCLSFDFLLDAIKKKLMNCRWKKKSWILSYLRFVWNSRGLIIVSGKGLFAMRSRFLGKFQDYVWVVLPRLPTFLTHFSHFRLVQRPFPWCIGSTGPTGAFHASTNSNYPIFRTISTRKLF